MAALDNRVLTSWIRDVSSTPSMGGRWPMVELDERLVQDYFELMDLAAEWSYNGIVLWGLFVGRNWPVSLQEAFEPRRMERVRRLMERAQRRGLTFYVGLGVYSWGFEELIRACPNLRRGGQVKAWGRLVPHNGDVMCLHEPQARNWMRRIIDGIVEAVDPPGFQLQPFDRGRCMCGQCAKLSDAGYFSALIGETSSYIKGKWPKKKIGVSGWGMRYNAGDALAAVQAFADQVDYLSDVTNTCLDRGEDYRKQFIRAVGCAFGDSAGGSVTPPQTWDRLRWYLPHIRFNGEAIRRLARDGGRAVEVFAGPVKNPGTRVSLMALGYLAAHPEEGVERAARLAVERAYGISGEAAGQVAQGVLSAERAYFEHCAPHHRGDLLFEPLESVFPGPPIYLMGAEREALQAYKAGMERLRREMARFGEQAANRGLMEDTLRAMECAALEAGEVLSGVWAR